MEVIVLPDASAAARLAADAVQALLAGNPAAVLGVATGSSPQGLYAELVDRYRRGAVSFARARAFMLDEYVGLPAGHPESYREVVRRDLETHLDFAAGAVQGPDGTAVDLPQAAADYDVAITAAGGIDLQVLGIGSDGHIAFNEPGSSLSSRTRLKTLTLQTRRDNARFFGGDLDRVPHWCLTQGLGTIGDARHLVLLASGESKADAVAGMVEGPLSASCPASVVQWHRHVTVLLDPAAASKLRHRDYYDEVFTGKPTWQGL